MFFSMIAVLLVTIGILSINDKPAPARVTHRADSFIVFGDRTMTVSELKAEHERLACYMVSLLYALGTNNVEIDRWEPAGTNWQLNIQQAPGNTNRMVVKYKE